MSQAQEPMVLSVHPSMASRLTDGFIAERVIAEWIRFYSSERPHSALDGLSPEQAYGRRRPLEMMDKARALPTVPQVQQQQEGLHLNRKLVA